MSEVFSDEDTTRLFQLVHMFQRSALLHMGYIPDQNGNKYYDLAEAKEAIDLLTMLQNKTKGNLIDREMVPLPAQHIVGTSPHTGCNLSLSRTPRPLALSLYASLCDRSLFAGRSW